ncbi:hypothetical protein SDC9_26644 [bioreactor metagenome]|jgi:hypothetical protein|uniref:Uncharacterized protein n=1 Tax=bioreactor metagenome TaxID=1076179 RepID=A0A644UPZ5_9ZZZZ
MIPNPGIIAVALENDVQKAIFVAFFARFWLHNSCHRQPAQFRSRRGETGKAAKSLRQLLLNGETQAMQKQLLIAFYGFYFMLKF